MKTFINHSDFEVQFPTEGEEQEKTMVLSKNNCYFYSERNIRKNSENYKFTVINVDEFLITYSVYVQPQ